MKRFTIITVFLFILLTGNSTITSAASHTYSDVPKTHSNYEDVMYLLERGIILKNTTYGINDIMTREDVAVMIAKALQLNGTQRATKFSDVPQSHVNSGYIQSAVEAGIINGYGNGTFKPNEKITRGHMATFIARAFTLPNGTQTFSDVSPGHTAYEAVQQLAAAGITTGYGDGTFKPEQNLSRAHISAFLTRTLVYNDVHNFDVEAFLKTVYAQDNADVQLDQLDAKLTEVTALFAKEDRALNELLAQKKELEASIATTQQKLKPIQEKVDGYHAAISAANSKIQQYRANNKHLVNGTAKQKEQYVQTLDAMQAAYTKTQKQKEVALAERDKFNAQYNKQKNSLNQLRTAIQMKQQAVTKQKETSATLKTATTTVNTTLAENNKQVQLEQAQRTLEQQQREQAQRNLEQQQLEQAQRTLEQQQLEQAQRTLEQQQLEQAQRNLEQQQLEQAQRNLEQQQREQAQRTLEQQQREQAQRELEQQWDEELENNVQHSTPTTEAPSSTENNDFVNNQATEKYEELVTTPMQPTNLDADQFEEEVVALVNEERAKEGLAPLQIDRALMAAAREKSHDMSDNDYFSHTSPTYGSPFDRLTALGITYTAAGENIAAGQRTAQQVMTSWMNSPGHRANILNADFTYIGVGFAQDGYIWTQQFIKK